MLQTTKARVLHYIILATFILFCIAAIVLGEIFNAYDAFWWWDDMLHLVSGILFGAIGLVMIYLFNAKYNMGISPLFTAVFVFCFAMAIGAVWEIFEFGMDFFFATAMQQWNLPADAMVMGKEYQGIGLRDSMADLILASIGAIPTAIFSFLAYKYKKPLVMSVMRRMFPWVNEKRS